jgi:hypothetical protein
MLIEVDDRKFDSCLTTTSDTTLEPKRQFVMVVAVGREVTITLPPTRLLGPDDVICVQRDQRSTHDVLIMPSSDEEDTVNGAKRPARLTVEGLPALFFEVKN